MTRNEKWNNKNLPRGFTLLEILIALFIFTILSTLLVGALRSVINVYEGTAKNAERLHSLQVALLLFSRDIEQIVNRPIFVATGKEEAALIGSPYQLTFTQVGAASLTKTVAVSALKRSVYAFKNHALIRERYAALDRVNSSSSPSRRLLEKVTDGHFEYLDQEGRFHTRWPVEEKKKQILPRAVRIHLTISGWGSISQLYVISSAAIPTPPTTLPQKP